MFNLAVATIISTFGFTFDDIDRYRVEKWGDFYNVILISEGGTYLGNISFLPPEGEIIINSMVVSIGDETYAVTVTEDSHSKRGVAEFKQLGEVVGYIDIGLDHYGNIKLKNVSATLEKFSYSFELVISISKDKTLIRKLRNPILLDSISGGEAFWCGVGMMGASIVFTPAGGFLYGVSCGLFADLDSWSFGGFGGGGGSSGTSPGHNGPKEYQVKTIWR